MVGIVIVSHSRLLAEGVAELAIQMTQGKASIAVAGGVDDAENPIGTDGVKVMEAIEQVFDESGVLVLMDMGSALLSTEMALELLPEEISQKVELCSAPIVEGTMAASVAAMTGQSLESVKDEANNALMAKRAHLGDEDNVQEAEAQVEVSADVLESEIWTVQNPHGIHARPSASIVSQVAPFNTTVWLAKGEKRVNAKSLNAIASLGVLLGDSIQLLAEGTEAQQAIDAFESLARRHFDEDICAVVQVEEEIEDEVILQTIDGALSGLSVCGGIASGPVVQFANAMPEVPERVFESYDIEAAYFSKAVESVKQQMHEQEKNAQGKVGDSHSGIFEAHVMLLTDPELESTVFNQLKQSVIVEQAWMSAISDLAAAYAQSESQYLKEREADVWDVGRQLMVELCGVQSAGFIVEQPSIIIAEDLSPSDTAKLDPEKVLGICLSGGGKTSHSAILARAMGIPALVKVQGLDNLTENQLVTIDGFGGLLWLTPNQETRDKLEEKRVDWLEQTKTQLENANKPAVTLDGTKVDVLANIGGLEDVSGAIKAGAEGVGLLRTEFLFQGCEALPDEQDQYQTYVDIAAALDGRPLTIRSLDVGGDKPMPAYPVPEEENPFLGLRGVRLCLADHDLFKVQLRAVLRAASEYSNIQLMIPMISNTQELRQVKALVTECRIELDLPENKYPMKLGIMIEVPSAVLSADALAKEADFFSIGTNDLTQYIMAADRGNPAVAEIVNYHQPAVIKAIELTCKAGIKANIPVSMCGEMAGDDQVTQQLVNMGLVKLSASASMIPGIKAKVRVLDISKQSISA